MRFTIPFFKLFGITAAHTTFTNFFINGQPQGDGVCVRMSLTPQNATFPLPNITAPEMACGVDGNTGVARVCPAPAGAVMGFEFREWPDNSQPGSIDPSHKGPIAVYMKQVADPTANGTATGNGWFKIYEADYDNSTQKWATETLIANNGHLSVTLPSDVPQGYYLVRTELLALHEASATPPDPQFYVGCAQIFLQSNGSTNPLNQASIPGYVDMVTNKAAMTFNIYQQPMALPYPMFGPPVYTQGPTNGDVAPVTGDQTIGLKPEGCVLVNANWCGVELESYNDQNGCWNASQNCWAQCKDCYDQAPPTGSKNCQTWETKCSTIDDACNANNFTGPPDQGKDLTPPLPSNVSLPPPANGQMLCANCGNHASTAPQQAEASGGDCDASTSTSTISQTSTTTITLPASSAAAAAAASSEAGQTTTLYSTIFSTTTSTLLFSSAAPSYVPKSAYAASTFILVPPPPPQSSLSYALSPPAASPVSVSSATSPAAQAAAPATNSTPSANTTATGVGSFDACGARNNSAVCAANLCCSQYGYCGSTSDYCRAGCQPLFGACDVSLPVNGTSQPQAPGQGQSSGSGSGSGQGDGDGCDGDGGDGDGNGESSTTAAPSSVPSVMVVVFGSGSGKGSPPVEAMPSS